MNDPFCQAVEAAWRSGIVAVVASGNNGRDNSQGTNGYATITRAGDLIAGYSSKGPTLLDHIVKPDLAAPGNMVISSLVRGTALFGAYPGNEVPFRCYNRAKHHLLIKSLLQAERHQYGGAGGEWRGSLAVAEGTRPDSRSDQGPAHEDGFEEFSGLVAGYLDVGAAITSTDVSSAQVSAKSPVASYDSASGNVYLVSDSSAIWGSGVSTSSALSTMMNGEK